MLKKPNSMTRKSTTNILKNTYPLKSKKKKWVCFLKSKDEILEKRNENLERLKDEHREQSHDL